MRFAAEHGLRGGILLPAVPDDAKHIKPLYAPDYDPLWAACEELGVVVNTPLRRRLARLRALPGRGRALDRRDDVLLAPRADAT